MNSRHPAVIVGFARTATDGFQVNGSGKWRSLRDSNPCFRRERAAS